MRDELLSALAGAALVIAAVAYLGRREPEARHPWDEVDESGPLRCQGRRHEARRPTCDV